MDSMGVYEECLLDWMIDSYQPLSAFQKDSFRKSTHCLYWKAPIIGDHAVIKKRNETVIKVNY